MKTAKRPALVRYQYIDEKVGTGQFPNASSLGRELEVTPRTIHRDIDYLRDFYHAPIYFHPQRNGFFYSDPNYRLQNIVVPEGEFIALFLAERLAQSYRGTPYAALLTKLFDRIGRVMTEPISIDLEHIAHSLSYHPTNIVNVDLAIMDQLHEAVRNHHQLDLVYYSASSNRTEQRTVDPYHLASIAGDWYLIAFCHLRNATLTFAAQRIRKLQIRDDTFIPDPAFDISKYLGDGFRGMRGTGEPQTVRLRFTPQAARYVREKQWHPTQKIHEHADGSLTLLFRVNHLLEVKRWVLSFGADCEVERPKELRAEIERDIRAMLANYEQVSSKNHYKENPDAR